MKILKNPFWWIGLICGSVALGGAAELAGLSGLHFYFLIGATWGFLWALVALASIGE